MRRSGNSLLTTEQRQWQDMRKLIARQAPAKRPARAPGNRELDTPPRHSFVEETLHADLITAHDSRSSMVLRARDPKTGLVGSRRDFAVRPERCGAVDAGDHDLVGARRLQ